MKNLKSLFIFLCFSVTSSFSQHPPSLKVGQPAPLLSVFKWLKGNPIRQWSKDKIYVVEFGATWCAPCAAAIPELAALQKKYPDEVTVISLFVMEKNTEPATTRNPAYVIHVENYIKKRSDKMNYTIGIDGPHKNLERTWLRNAGLNSIPQIFIIDKTGVINWIGGNFMEVEEVIKCLKTNEYNLSKKVQQNQEEEATKITYDRSKLLLIENNGGKETDFLFRSLLTRYNGKMVDANTEYVQNYYWRKPDSLYDQYEDRFEVIGAPLSKLYYLAFADTLSNTVQFRNYYKVYTDTVKNPYHKTSYGKYWHEPILEVADKSPFEYSWNNTRHRYNYSLKVPKGTGTAYFLQAAFRNDLETYFGYQVSVETQWMPYWKLSAPDKSLALSKLKAKDQSLKVSIIDREMPFIIKNGEMRDLVMLLASTYGYGTLDYGRLPRSEQAAFIDKTGITEKIDFTFDRNLTFEQMKIFLHNLGLEVSKDTKPMKVVVIRDARQVMDAN